jgi:hypothetical protein
MNCFVTPTSFTAGVVVPEFSIVTDQSGEFDAPLMPGEWVFAATCPGGLNGRSDLVTLVDQGVTHIEIVVEESGSVASETGSVVEKSGLPAGQTGIAVEGSGPEAGQDEPAPGLTRWARPALKGKAVVGRLLKASMKGWSRGTVFTYKWKVAGKVKGTSKDFRLRRAYQGKRVTLEVIGKLGDDVKKVKVKSAYVRL